MKKGDSTKTDRHGLTRKEKAFADELRANPKISATEAVARTYAVKDRRVAGSIAGVKLKKAEIMAYLAGDVEVAKGAVVHLAGKYKSKSVGEQRIALDASKDILDRTLGKAVQRHQVQSKSIVISLDLTGDDVEV